MTDGDRDPTPGVRLQKVLAQAGLCSRRGGEALIAAGRVRVNDKVVTGQGVRVDPVGDQIMVDGKVVEPEQAMFILLNKPDGVVASGEREQDERGRPTVVSLLRGVTQRVLPVGRLDFHSRGALILTNDGELSSQLTHPRHEIEKTYHAKLQGQLETDALDALSRGVTLDDGVVTHPIEELVVVKETEANTWLQLTIKQSLPRQVRRMGEAIGHPVLKLIRVSFADLTIDGLADGEWRPLTVVEIARLRSEVGVRKPRETGSADEPKRSGGSRGRRGPGKGS